MNSLDQVLESALQLTEDQQEILITVLKNRYHQNRRKEIAVDAQQTLSDFYKGNFQPQSAKSVIAELRQSLTDSEL